MTLPNMTRAVKRWSKRLEIVNQVISTVDFEPFETVTARTVVATVQPAQKNRINPDIINWSLKYVQVHSVEEIKLGEFFKHQGVIFKVVEDGDFQRYGYTDAICEEVKDCHVKYNFTD
jgi:hypothetical protein